MRALIVDDDSVALEMLAMMVAALGHDVARATSGPEALAYLRTSRFDCLIVDYYLQGMDGLDVIIHARSVPGMERLPIVIVTAAVEDIGAYALAEAEKDGPSWLVLKPFDPAALATVLAEIEARKT